VVYISDGQSDLCEPPVDPFDTNLDRHRDWIRGSDGGGGMIALTGAIPTFQKDCGAIEQLPELVVSGDIFGDCDPTEWSLSPEPRTCGFTGFLDAGGVNSAARSFPVPAGTTLLRVAFNGVASSSNAVDTNYYLRASAPATLNDYDCAATGPGTIGFCEVENPTVGTWHTLIDQTLYQGEYQVTVTLFGPLPSEAAPPEVPSLDLHRRMLLIGAMSCLILLALGRRSPGRTGTGSGSLPH
jgi:hypothetical protein